MQTICIEFQTNTFKQKKELLMKAQGLPTKYHRLNINIAQSTVKI